MSFDDVASRMRGRHGASPVTVPFPENPDADKFVLEAQRMEKQSKARADLVLGGLLFGAGLLISVVTHDSASRSGGTYIVAWGPMLYGLIRLVRGCMGIGG